MKNKKIVLIIIIIIALLLIGGLSYYFLTKEDKNTTLNLFEKQWIENNKNNIIDMSIVNQIPILSYNGEGIIIDFLDSLNKDTNLSFNKISYSLGEEVKTDYSFKLVDEVLEDNILIYEDNYVVVTKKDTYLGKIKVYNDNNLLYGPAFEWCMDTVDVSKYMETSIPNLFAIGDGAGLSQGIMYSAATGVIAAKCIIERMNSDET